MRERRRLRGEGGIGVVGDEGTSLSLPCSMYSASSASNTVLPCPLPCRWTFFLLFHTHTRNVVPKSQTNCSNANTGMTLKTSTNTVHARGNPGSQTPQYLSHHLFSAYRYKSAKHSTCTTPGKRIAVRAKRPPLLTNQFAWPKILATSFLDITGLK